MKKTSLTEENKLQFYKYNLFGNISDEVETSIKKSV